MMNNTLKSAGEVEGELTEAVYEPKMTRSKIREVLEKSEVCMHIHKKNKYHISIEIYFDL